MKDQSVRLIRQKIKNTYLARDTWLVFLPLNREVFLRTNVGHLPCDDIQDSKSEEVIKVPLCKANDANKIFLSKSHA